MSSQSRLSPWPQNTHIPGHEPRDEHGASNLNRIAEQPPIAPEITLSTGSNIRHVLAARSLQHLPSATNLSRKLANGGASRRNKPLQPRRPGLRYFSRRKAHFPTGQRVSDADTTREISSIAKLDDQSSHRVGIMNGPTTQSLVLSIPSKFEEEKSTDKFAQRLEKRTSNYGSVNNLAQIWLLEIICLITSILSMGAIIGVLLFLKNERLPKWPLGLTLNAYISVLSKVAGAALLVATSESLGQLKWHWFQQPKKLVDFEIFDNASRGPWGAFILLLRTKARSLASLGAIITIFALGLDPFFQQVVDFPERWTSSGLRSSVPIVRFYKTSNVNVFVNGETTPVQEGFIRTVTDRFFIANGTQPVHFDGVTKPEIPVFCPTSNCTWPEYESLGVCSACTDVPDLLTFGCLSTRVDWVRNLTGVNTAESAYPNGTQCGYFLNITSEMPILMSGYLMESVQAEAGSAAAGEALLMRVLPFMSNPSRIPLYGDGSINFKHIRNKIQDGIFSSIPDGLTENVYQNKTPIVQECMIAWCVRKFHSSYYLGTYQENITDTYFNDTGIPGAYPYLFDPDGVATEYEGNVAVQAPYGNSSAIYGVSNITAIRTVNILDDIFPSFYTAQNSSDQPSYRFQTNTLIARWRTVDINPWLSPNNVTEYLERFSIAITNALRSSNSSETFLGQALVVEAYVAVRWEWLSLPIGLLMCSAVFLGATMRASSRQKNVWKTSAIATLVYNLPDDAKNKIRSPNLAGTPSSRAMEVMIILQSKDSRVSESSPSSMTPKEVRNWPPPGWI